MQKNLDVLFLVLQAARIYAAAISDIVGEHYSLGPQVHRCFPALHPLLLLPFLVTKSKAAIAQ